MSAYESRRCAKCKNTRPVIDFNKNQAYCKQRQSMYQQEYRNRPYRKEYRGLYQREYYHKNHDRLLNERRLYEHNNAGHILKVQRQYHKAHRERHNEWSRRYYAHSQEKMRQWRLSWIARNKERKWALGSLNNHGKRFEIAVTLNELIALARRTKTCPICEEYLNYDYGTKKHIQPNSPSLDRIDNESVLRSNNVWIICARCNTTKQTLSLRSFVNYCRMVAEKFGSEPVSITVNVPSIVRRPE
jgi:hypothetical protein